MKKLLLSFSILAIAFGYKTTAQVSITSVATPYTQNFDALSNDTTNVAHAMALTGWALFEKGTSAAVDQMYKVNNGSKNAGDVYSYGDSTVTDRALGSLASGTNLPAYGVAFQNNTGSNITDLTISYKGEQWRSGDTSASSLDSVIFEYSTTATAINDTAATWNPIASLMLNTINLVTTTAGILDGNNAPNTTTKSGTISVLLTNGSKILLRWRDINKSGSDDGLAIDDLSVSFSGSGNPKPVIVAKNPADDATSVSPSITNLSMTFDQIVTVGTGNVTIKNLTDVTQQIIACATTTIAGTIVTIPGVTLMAGKQYAVNFDSTCYVSSTSANSYGIYDNTSWNFETMPNGLIDYNSNNLELQLSNNNELLFSVNNSEWVSVTLFDMNCKTVKHLSVRAQQGENKISLQSESLVNGIYFIKVENKNYRGVLKFVKQ